MARLIDASEAKRRIVEFTTGCHPEVLTVDSIVMLLDKTPTVDAAPVVRCEKCNYGHWLSGAKKYACRHPLYTGGNKHSGDHFCSYAERRTGDA